MKKACQVCKNRKKRCSGGSPCDYCVKIGEPKNCLYQKRISRKRVKVTEHYLLSLKARIKELEHRLGDSSSAILDSSQEVSPLFSASEEGGSLESTTPADEPIITHKFHYLGDSACQKYLLKIKQSIMNSSRLITDMHNSNFRTISLDINPNISLVQSLAADVCPSIDEAKKCIASAREIIAADYMFIEPDYEVEVLENLIYGKRVSTSNFVEYSTEMARFLMYLSLGRLFEREGCESTKSRFPGLSYFECALKLQGELLKVYDCVANTSLVQSFLYVAYYALSLDKSAFAFIQVGNAIRMMYTLGHHKEASNSTQSRVFWLCYLYDRVVAVRFGYPLAIKEVDIDIPLPISLHSANMVEQNHFIYQVKLAKITTNIIQKIYTRNSSSLISNCQLVLTELKDWLDHLPDELVLNMKNLETGQSRSTVNLHINYNYSIMITTRPVLFFVFNRVVKNGKIFDKSFPPKLLTLIETLLRSSVEAATIQSIILSTLYSQDKMANASFLDCHYIFSATMILIFAAFCQSLPSNSMSFECDITSLFERVQANLAILQGLSQYNIPASNFNRQLTEFIDLIGSKGVQTNFRECFQSDQTQKEEDSRSVTQEKSQFIKNIDLTSVIDDMNLNCPSDDSIFLESDDFLRQLF